MSNINDKKRHRKDEIKKLVSAGVVGGTLGGIKEGGKTIASNHSDYSKLRKMYIKNELSKHIADGLSKKDAVNLLKNEFMDKTIELSKVIKGYTGNATPRISEAYILKAMHEMPYKTLGGITAGIPAGVLAYGALSSIKENRDKIKNLDKVRSEVAK